MMVAHADAAPLWSSDDIATRFARAIESDVDFLSLRLPSADVVHGMLTHPSLAHRVIGSRDGPVSIVQGTEARNDRSKSYSQFGFHVDGLYHPRIPEYVLLACADPGTAQIQTHISSVDDAVITLSSADQELLRSATFSYLHRDGRVFERPLVECEESGPGRLWVNLAARGWLRVRTEGDVTNAPDYIDLARAFVRFYEALEDRVRHKVTWQTGTAVLFHNRRHAHARSATSVTQDPQRRLIRVWFAA